MSPATVDELLRQIQNLPDEERRLLQERLDELADSEWREEAAHARREASQRGLDQAAIDRAVYEVRYGL
jgi:hypothetical protein